ncbi:MAG: L,D-transpeptidase family protein [Deltaproteobacteria bacterium]|nr:L,D-transpeptidase family protein [Deltaproteobacteria bacterium]
MVITFDKVFGAAALCVVLVLFIVFGNGGDIDITARAEASEAEELILPASVISLQEGSELLLVDKGSHTLYLYSTKGFERFNITSGQAKGDKQKRGDLKTPEGVYFFNKVIEGKDLPSKYGVLALVTDYPNPVDRANKKSGSGIWLHGTDDPPRLERPRDSRGCTVLLNEDVLKITKQVKLGETPMVVEEEVLFIGSTEFDKKREELFKELKRLELITAESAKDHTILMAGGMVTVSRVVGTENLVTYLNNTDNGYEVVATQSLSINTKEPSDTALRLGNKN